MSYGVVGIFSDNEIDFSSTNVKLLDRVLDSGNTEHPAYKSAKAFMEEKGATETTSALNEEWVGMLAEKYYKGVKEGIAVSDPKMLYLGSRLHGAPKMYQSIIRAADKWCENPMKLPQPLFFLFLALWGHELSFDMAPVLKGVQRM